jgi:hypothetical protein
MAFDGHARRTIDPGEVVHVPVGLRHWHGATPDQAFVHLAVTAGGDTVWLGEVTPSSMPRADPGQTPTSTYWSSRCTTTGTPSSPCRTKLGT